MKISERTLKALGKIVTGDEELSPYKSGQKLINLFNELGSNDIYGPGFPSRWNYAEDSLRKINDKPTLNLLIEMIFDPREYLGTAFDINKALNFFNSYFSYEGYQVVIVNGYAKIRDLKGSCVDFIHPFSGSEDNAHIFIDEQIIKCDSKILSGDYDGAITNARSLIEAILTEIEKELDVNSKAYDGDLTKLYKRVVILMNLDPSQKEASTAVKQIFSGLNSIISGIASLRNKMSDAHVATYKPSKHHAKLAVNSAKTIVDFLLEAKYYQQLTKTRSE